MKATVALTAALALSACAGVGGPPLAHTPIDPRPRVVVTTDPELDDSNSLLRYLLYSPDFRTEALIYASSGVHWRGDGQGTMFLDPESEEQRFGLNLCPCTSWRWAEDERFIHDAIDVYAQAWPDLRVHDPRYPDPAELRSRILWGNVDFPGDISRDTEGSDHIRELLLGEEPGPIYLLAWGGTSTIARALKSIEEEYSAGPDWPATQRRVSERAIIQAFGDQDGSWQSYIAPRWPDVEFRQMATQIYGYGARSAVLPEDAHYLSAEWTARNVSDRGPMGAHYRVWGDGKQMVKDDPFDYFGYAGLDAEQLRATGYVVWFPVQQAGSWISEGDTSTFMNLIDNGLRGHVHQTYGGWGGRTGEDIGPNGPDPQYSSVRFFGAAQRDFAARMQWAVTPDFADANHPPQIALDGASERWVRAGERLALTARASDPDGDSIALRWWQYLEADTYPGEILPQGVSGPQVSVTIPADAQPGQTIHLIVQGEDDGTPSLTRYRRVVLHIAR